MCGILIKRQYAVLVYQGRLLMARTEFVVVALVCLVLQFLHDDFARIWLNKRAKQLIAAPKPRGEEYAMAPVPPQVPGGLTAEQREAALVEYQAAQDSA